MTPHPGPKEQRKNFALPLRKRHAPIKILTARKYKNGQMDLAEN